MVNHFKYFLSLFYILMIMVSLIAEESVSQDKAFTNRNFKVYIKTNIPFSRDLNVENTLTEDCDMKQTREPYLQSYDGLTDNEGEYIYEDLTEIVLSLNSPRGDIFYCDSLKLFREKFELLIPPFPVIVNNQDERNIEYPIELYWTKPKEQVYLGDTLPLILNIRYMDNLEFPEQITMAKPSMGNLEQVELSGNVDSFPMGDNQIYSYPLESWYFTANEVGKVSIRGGFVRIKGLKRVIPDLDFEVLPLPEEIKSSGAVGLFTMETRVSQKSLKEGDILSLTINVEGEGNLPYLNLPKVHATGLTLIGTKDKEEILSGEEGFSGFREQEFRYQAGNEAKGLLRVESFSWINPQTNQISGKQEILYQFNIEEKDSVETNTIRLLTVDEIDQLIIKEWFNNRSFWLLLLPGLLFFIINLFLLNKKSEKSLLILVFLFPVLFSFSLSESHRQLLIEGEKLVEEGDYDNALDLYKTFYEENPSSGIQYNMAIISHMKGDLVECELLLRSALMVIDDYGEFHNSLVMIEDLYGLSDQFSSHGIINSFQIKIFLILLINLILVFSSLYLKRKSAILLFFDSTVLVLILSASLGLLVLEWNYGRTQGVVMEQGGELQRIPEETASKWLTLKAGTAVHVKAEKAGYYFIKTGYGLEGWFPVKDLILVEKGYH